MKNYLTEFIGTFFLVLTIGLTVVVNSPMAPLAIGAALMVMVYMGGHISGGHYNPAVSLAALIRGALKPKEFVPYIVAQLVGAFAAAAVVHLIYPDKTFACAPGNGVTFSIAVLNEALYTFALALVVLNVATSKKTAGNSYYGLAIGFTVVVGAFAGGGISGGAYNPAVGAGPILFDSLLCGGHSMPNLAIYLIGPFVGAAAAAAVFKVQEAGN